MYSYSVYRPLIRIVPPSPSSTDVGLTGNPISPYWLEYSKKTGFKPPVEKNEPSGRGSFWSVFGLLSSVPLSGLTCTPNKEQDFVEEIDWSNISELEDLEFPPGHPQCGALYRVHPINENQYIPIENFDDVLNAEREFELVRLLTDLGATSIFIQELFLENEAVERGVETTLATMSSVKIQAKRGQESYRKNSRSIQLPGKQWIPDMKLDEAKYHWLAYEPDWKAIAYARCEGECLSAEIRLANGVSPTLTAEFESSGLLKALASIDVKFQHNNRNQWERVFTVQFAA